MSYIAVTYTRVRDLLEIAQDRIWPRRYPLSVLGVLIAGVFVLFWQLGTLSVRMVDESRLAVNAQEMALSGNWLVTHYHNQPDLYNTKPPLLIWAIAASMKVFGYNEWALRFPSAVCALLTLVAVLAFCKQYFPEQKVGPLSGLVLITSPGFVGFHVGRTGDYDAMLVLWSTLYSLGYFVYLHSEERERDRPLVLAAFALLLAFLTKGVAGGLCLPGLFIYTLYRRKLGQVFTSPLFYGLIAGVGGGVIGYYLLREHFNPGYLEAVVRNEVSVRYFQAAEGNDYSPLFYFRLLLGGKFLPWILLMPAAFGLIHGNTDGRNKQFGRFAAIFLVAFFAVITVGKTKLAWYDAPAFPVASIFVGLGLAIAIDRFKKDTVGRPPVVRVTALAALTGALVLGVVVSDITPVHPDKESSQLQYGYYLRELPQEVSRLGRFSLIEFANGRLNDGPPNGDSRGFDYEGYYAPVLFYKQALGLRGIDIDVRTLAERKLHPAEVVLTCNRDVREQIVRDYGAVPIHKAPGYGCGTLQVPVPASPTASD